ncbi:putative vesicle-fusing ATPase [Helianthus anomalus]
MLIVCAMYRSFREQAIEYVKQAAQEDSAGNYAKAFPLYMNALDYFKTYAKYENNYKIREAVMQKVNEYLRRAEEIRAVLDEFVQAPLQVVFMQRCRKAEKVLARQKPTVSKSDLEIHERSLDLFMSTDECILCLFGVGN